MAMLALRADIVRAESDIDLLPYIVRTAYSIISS